jgi:hypothetical protein
MMAAMNWPQQPPPPPGYGYPPAPPLPADDRIKQAVRRGEVFADPTDAVRAVAYAEKFLKTGADLARPPVIGAMFAGLLFAILLQITAGVVYVLVIPAGLFVGILGYLAFWSANKDRVRQSLEANRRVAGG